jgi:hypothetical protein
MISELAVTKQTHSGGVQEQRYLIQEDPETPRNTNDVQNKTSYFGFRVSTDFKSQKHSHPDSG